MYVHFFSGSEHWLIKWPIDCCESKKTSKEWSCIAMSYVEFMLKQVLEACIWLTQVHNIILIADMAIHFRLCFSKVASTMWRTPSSNTNLNIFSPTQFRWTEESCRWKWKVKVCKYSRKVLNFSNKAQSFKRGLFKSTISRESYRHWGYENRCIGVEWWWLNPLSAC